MDNYYIINSYLDRKFVSISDVFHSKTDVLKFKKILDSQTPSSSMQHIIFECKPMTNDNVNVNVTDTDTDNVTDNDTVNDNVTVNDNDNDMILYKYKSGYVLIPTKDNTYYGMEKLNRGWWCEDIKGWYYLKEEYDNLIDREYNVVDTLKTDYQLYDFNKFELFFYNTGFILSPKKTYKYYGQQYLMGNIWDEEQHGWFFPTVKKYKKFIELGAIDYSNDTFLE